MPKSKLLYLLMLIVSIVFIIYVLYINFIYDPQAAEFLSRKTNLKRSVNIPAWLTVMKVHVVLACLAMVSGAVNFSHRIQRKYRKFHRINGYVYLISVIAVVITSGYMAPYSTGGKVNSIAFNLLNIIWPIVTITAIVKIKKKQVNNHRKWMVRSYAFCFTNMAIHMITSVFNNGFGIAYSTSYTIGVYGSILLLPLLAEAVFRFKSRVP
ncbi:DUF2306 domain-containing protein [Paenibacillus sedimenti]|uniref:DUF2306 domain-containing protein n=1 Tax=Paenibacillus sedimenti TaxID=2770274 RepID=A0A926KRU3_9BACL|nr:DUF2306 domain-containing protein [Paenibacillus sedimenti]MBD0381976.1 DUF2306 domain-containing protein [Paenibacillus sedimenti]